MPLAAAAALRRLTAAIGWSAVRRRFRCLPFTCLAAAGCIAAPVVVVIAVGSAVLAAVAGDSSLSSAGCPASCSGNASPPLLCARLTVSQGFGDTPWEHPHTGIDLVCPDGTAVRALLGGEIHHLSGGDALCLFPWGRRGGLGTFAAVVSGRVTVLYGHLESYAVPDGSVVFPGQIIASEGATGCATGPHLHLQVDVAGVPVDPCPYLPAGYPMAHQSGGQRCWGTAPP